MPALLPDGLTNPRPSGWQLCTFMIKRVATDSSTTLQSDYRDYVPWHQIASDGISYTQPRFRSSNREWTSFGATLSHVEGASSKNVFTAFTPGATADSAINSPDLQHFKARMNSSQNTRQALQAYLSLGGGQREDLLVMFPYPGRYLLQSFSNAFDSNANPNLGSMNDDMMISGCPECAAIAVIEVTGEEDEDAPTYFTRGRDLTGHTLCSARQSIDPERKVARRRAITFDANFNQEAAPFPLYTVGSFGTGSAEHDAPRAYDVNHIDMTLSGGDCEIWVVASPNAFAHPFHMHVNPFLVLGVQSQFNNFTFGYFQTEFGRTDGGTGLMLPDYTNPWLIGQVNTWRDTVMIPPWGQATIKICFDAGLPMKGTESPNVAPLVKSFRGKFVFHCHFLARHIDGLSPTLNLTFTLTLTLLALGA